MMKLDPALCRFRILVSLALTLSALVPAAAAATEFPFDRQLMLDVAPMGKVRRVPSVTISADGTARLELWCKTASAQVAIDAIRADPAYAGGDYAAEPAQGLRTATDLLILAGLNPVAAQAEAPTREQAEAMLAQRFEATGKGRDANDLIWQLDASRTYDPSAGLERMTMPVTWVNSADDFINPPGLGIAERAAKRLPTGRFVLIPQSAETKGHGTHTWAKFWKGELVDLLKRSE